jgi:acetyltransferase
MADDADWAIALTSRVALKDGTQVTIRPIRPGDLGLHADFVHALSARTGYMRLLSPRIPQDDELRRMTQIHYPEELALVAIADVDGRDVEVGVARYAPTTEPALYPGRAEFAIVLSDAWQGRGLAKLLLGRLVDAATAAGVRELADITLHDNLAMMRLAKSLGFTVQRDPGDMHITRLRKVLTPPSPTVSS